MDNKQTDGQNIFTPKAATVLNEILAALNRLAATGEEYTIFIDKMGLDIEDRQIIREFLGVGGIKINYDATSQPVQWLESGISGVWFGVFYDANQKPLMETIEVCRFPQVAAAQQDDIKSGIALMSEKLGVK